MRIKHNEALSRFEKCGENQVCGLKGNELIVFDIEGSKLKKLFVVGGVTEAVDSADGLIALRKNDLIRIDVKNRRANIDYTLGDLNQCGVSHDGNQYTVCVIDSTSTKRALLVNTALNNTDSIDQKINKLAQDGHVKTLSVYKTFIYVSPELGEREYISQIGGFGYSEQKTVDAFEAINKKALELGIDPSVYSIINVRKLGL